MKKLLSIFLVAVLLITAMPLGAFNLTASAATSGYYTYTVSNGEATITDVDEAISGDVTIPLTIEGYPVTSIGSFAFYRCEGITSIILPDSLKSIDGYAFYYCNSLESITLPFVGADIDSGSNYDDVFGYIFGCSSFSMSVGRPVTPAPKEETKQYYSPSEFYYYYIPSSLKCVFITMECEIPYGAFYNCTNVISVTIPNTVTSIDSYSFYNCIMLNNVNYLGSCLDYSKLDINRYGNSCFFNANTTYSNNSIEDHAYDNMCDTICNVCNNVRTAEHTYDYVCDTICNVCNNVRTAEHTYDNTCDTICNICNDVRTIEHTFDNICDTTCNICGVTRTVPSHVYDSIFCDATCSVCGMVREISGHDYNTVDDYKICSKCKSIRLELQTIDYECLNVSYSDLIEYGETIENRKLIVTYKNVLLTENIDYIIKSEDFEKNVKITITGIKGCEGVSKTIEIQKTKKNISNAMVAIGSCSYKGYPVSPSITVKLGDITLKESRDYACKFYDNTYSGTGRVVIYGIGKYTGYLEKTFTIGAYAPSTTSKTFYSPSNGSAAIKGGKVILDFECIKSYSLKDSSGYVIQSNSYPAPGRMAGLEFDFSDRYSGTYYLTYVIQGSGVTVRPGSSTNPYYYTGTPTEYTITISNTRISAPSTKSPQDLIADIPIELDYKTLLLSVSSKTSNANLDNITWSIDNNEVGSIKEGVLSLKKAGDIVVTATIGKLNAKWEMHFDGLDISSKGKLLNFNNSTNSATVVYDGQILRPNVDYRVETIVKNGCKIVAIEGVNIFTGKIIEPFYNDSGNSFNAKGISIYKLPNKLSYLEGKDDLDLNGFEIAIDLGNGENFIFSPTVDMISGFNSSVIGPQTLTVTYKGKTATFNVTVIEKTLTSIVVTTKPNKLSYLEGESFNKTGMIVTAYYNNDTSENVTDYNISGYTHTPGTKTITVSYAGKSAMFDVNVNVRHVYDSACDTTCNICEDIRTIQHTYTNNCDADCNVCKATRTVIHNRKIYTTLATLSKDGKAVKKCTICGSISSQRVIKKVKSITLSTSTYLYNGKFRTPGVTVKDSAGKTIASKFYTVTYASGRKNVGTYKVTVKFKGEYSGSKTVTFTIVPPKTTVSRLTAGKKSFTANITKKSTQVTGYQIQYATNKNFTGAARKTVSSYKSVKHTFKNLKAKKTYYVRVRTYKTVGGKNYYSGWSTYKYVKTK